jgi:tRNA (guanine-N7-)-methyltransferase
MYKGFLKPDSQIWFKTDDPILFEDSQRYFTECGFDIIYITYNLHTSDFQDNIMTEYEIKFVEKGVPIMFLIARKNS